VPEEFLNDLHGIQRSLDIAVYWGRLSIVEDGHAFKIFEHDEEIWAAEYANFTTVNERKHLVRLQKRDFFCESEVAVRES